MAMNLPSTADAAPGLRGGRAVAVVVASFMLLAAAVTMVVVSANSAARQKLAESKNPIHLGALLTKKPTETVQPKVDPAPTNDPPKPEQKTYDDPLDDPALFQSLRAAFSRYDFAGMAGVVETANQYASTDAGKQLIDRYDKLNAYMGWFNTMLDPIDVDHHITIDTGQGSSPAYVWRAGLGQIGFRTAQSSWTAKTSDLTVEQIMSIGAQLEDLPGSNERLTRAEIDRDEKWLQEDAARFSAPQGTSSP